MITEKSIREAYIFLRENNHSIPDETLDFILKASLDALSAMNKSLLGDVEGMWSLGVHSSNTPVPFPNISFDPKIVP